MEVFLGQPPLHIHMENEATWDTSDRTIWQLTRHWYI